MSEKRMVLKYSTRTGMFVGTLNKSRLKNEAEFDYNKDKAKKQRQITKQGGVKWSINSLKMIGLVYQAI